MNQITELKASQNVLEFAHYTPVWWPPGPCRKGLGSGPQAARPNPATSGQGQPKQAMDVNLAEYSTCLNFSLIQILVEYSTLSLLTISN